MMFICDGKTVVEMSQIPHLEPVVSPFEKEDRTEKLFAWINYYIRDFVSISVTATIFDADSDIKWVFNSAPPEQTHLLCWFIPKLAELAAEKIKANPSHDMHSDDNYIAVRALINSYQADMSLEPGPFDGCATFDLPFSYVITAGQRERDVPSGIYRRLREMLYRTRDRAQGIGYTVPRLSILEEDEPIVKGERFVYQKSSGLSETEICIACQLNSMMAEISSVFDEKQYLLELGESHPNRSTSFYRDHLWRKVDDNAFGTIQNYLSHTADIMHR